MKLKIRTGNIIRTQLGLKYFQANGFIMFGTQPKIYNNSLYLFVNTQNEDYRNDKIYQKMVHSYTNLDDYKTIDIMDNNFLNNFK